MSTDDGYNGWKNYETWATALWINNDQGTQETALDVARGVLDIDDAHANVADGIWTVEQARRYELADRLRSWVGAELLPDLGATLAADLLNAAESEIDWHEIADSFLRDLAEIS